MGPTLCPARSPRSPRDFRRHGRVHFLTEGVSTSLPLPTSPSPCILRQRHLPNASSSRLLSSAVQTCRNCTVASLVVLCFPTRDGKSAGAWKTPEVRAEMWTTVGSDEGTGGM